LPSAPGSRFSFSALRFSVATKNSSTPRDSTCPKRLRTPPSCPRPLFVPSRISRRRGLSLAYRAYSCYCMCALISLISMPKNDIHPTYHKESKITCTCGAKFIAGATQPEIRVDICSHCHPYFTGEQKLIDTAGRVEKFHNRRAKAVDAKPKKVRSKKAVVEEAKPKEAKPKKKS